MGEFTLRKKGAYCIAATGNPKYGGGWNNQQLMKGTGLLAYMFHKKYGFKSVMVGLKADAEYPYLGKYLRGLELAFLPADTLLARINYIKSHVDEMDLLILYGAYPQHIPVAEAYKQLRPDGKIYLATDMNSKWVHGIQHEYPLYQKFFGLCDVIGASNSSLQKCISARWEVPVELIRNGWYNFADVSFEKLFERKGNIILTVGRIGLRQKRTEDLLEAFARASEYLSDWQLRLVGEVEGNFKPYLDKFFSLNPELKERVIFTGLVEDKAELMNEYKRAKIFCMTSTFECFPNAATEALFSGDFIITSSVDAAGDMTDNGKCGIIFPIGRKDILAKALRAVCNNQALILSGGKHAYNYARQEFDADKIVTRLYNLLFQEAS